MSTKRMPAQVRGMQTKVEDDDVVSAERVSESDLTNGPVNIENL